MSGFAVPSKTAVIVEDDPDVRDLLDEVFCAAGFRTVLATTGFEGVAAVQEHDPVITTLDVNLPGIDGFEAVRRIRKTSDTYIIMLSALAEESDIVLGLSSGADDYVTKPFRPRELRARIEAFMRRPRRLERDAFADSGPITPIRLVPDPENSDAEDSAAHEVPGAPEVAVAARNPGADAAIVAIGDGNAEWISHRDLSLDLATHTVLVAQREVELTPTEFDLLATLLESKRRVRSKSDLALVLRGEAFGSSYYVGEPDKRAIEAHIANLRRKLGDSSSEPNYIETVRGVGYRLTPQSDAIAAFG
ncbi:response regulator transcription factor [Microbacterium sp. USHLN186]|uniref:response regulator transcription factor n=1 Tax=Microbacterium sp. USHLN186 TaxID=3081286 RepID=UPI00301631D5